MQKINSKKELWKDSQGNDKLERNTIETLDRDWTESLEREGLWAESVKKNRGIGGTIKIKLCYRDSLRNELSYWSKLQKIMGPSLLKTH